MLREGLTTRENFHGHQDMAHGNPRMCGCQPQNYSCNILWLPPSSDRQPLGYHVHTGNRGGKHYHCFHPARPPSCPTVMSFQRRAMAGLLVLMTALFWQRPLAAAPVPVRGGAA